MIHTDVSSLFYALNFLRKDSGFSHGLIFDEVAFKRAFRLPLKSQLMEIARQQPPFCIGIGCSAGGLESVCEFFQQVVEKTGAAFVVIPHLTREHPSRFSIILSRFTNMPVHRVEDDIMLEADHVYVLVEDKMMIVEDGQLKVRKRYSREVINKAIDIFFKSMAKAYRESAIGIILSGMGSDGIAGITTIEEHHGLVIVQDPETTDFNILPQLAINKDDPHAILAPVDIARFLLKYLGASIA